MDRLRKLNLSSDIVLQDELNDTISVIVDGLSNTVNQKLSVIADLISAETEKVDDISGSLSNYALFSDIPLSTSQLINNSGFLTAHQSLSDYALSTDLYNLSNEVIDGISNVINPKLSIIADLVSAETKKVDELSGKLNGYALSSDIPLSTSQLINDSGFLTAAPNLDSLSDYLPLSGGNVKSGFALSTELDVGGVFLDEGGKILGIGAIATGAGAQAFGIRAIANGHESLAVGMGARIENDYNVDCAAVGFNAIVNSGTSFTDGGKSIQLGYGTNTTPHTLQVFNHTLMDTETGNIPEARVSALEYLKKSDLSLSDYVPLSSASAYALSADLSNLSVEIIAGISNTVNLKLSVIADLISAETNKIDDLSTFANDISSDFSNYATISSQNTLEARMLSTENLIGDILSILQDINGTEGE